MKPGPKLNKDDRIRLEIAYRLVDAGWGPWTALRRACHLHPSGLMGALPKTLSQPKPLFPEKIKLNHDEKQELTTEINRLYKAMKTNADERPLAEVGAVEGTAEYGREANEAEWLDRYDDE